MALINNIDSNINNISKLEHGHFKSDFNNKSDTNDN